MKTVRVRIAVAVDEKCQWKAYGHWNAFDVDMTQQANLYVRHRQHVVFVEADVPVPESPVIEGEVVN